MAVNVTAALVLKKLMEGHKIAGTIKIFPGVAEEILGSKAFYVRAGLFKDVDIVLGTHVWHDFSTSYGTGDGKWSGLVSVQYFFPREGSACGRRAMGWTQRVGRSLAHERGMGIPAGTLAAATALALRDHQRRRSAECRPVGGRGLVITSGETDLPAHQIAVRDRQHHQPTLRRR